MSIGQLDDKEADDALDLYLKVSGLKSGYSFAVVGTVLANMMVSMVLLAARQRPDIATLGIDAIASDMRAMVRDIQSERPN